ncbi:hypothetical protein ZIOFF_028970 [Zingiber officinale]|uniref:Uncharacterized protein n=1 Tax=Zingiber officinale TaxID=94328 RepID=A0A8J5GSY6_ZINOF|nr:hypothetical protein ZIOFF_028970 [Zingiber officinale]
MSTPLSQPKRAKQEPINSLFPAFVHRRPVPESPLRLSPRLGKIRNAPTLFFDVAPLHGLALFVPPPSLLRQPPPSILVPASHLLFCLSTGRRHHLRPHGTVLFSVGGRNAVLVHALSRRIPLVSDRPTIIFGADVTDPHPGEDSSPSIVVVSQDWLEVTKYAGLVCA